MINDLWCHIVLLLMNYKIKSLIYDGSKSDLLYIMTEIKKQTILFLLKVQ